MGRVRSALPRHRVPHIRLPLHRQLLADPQALRRWALVILLAALAAAVTGSVLSGAQAARRRWGETTPVLVVSAPVRAGDPLAAAAVATPWPLALVPDGAVVDLPADATASVALAAGQPLTESLLSAPDRPDGRRRVALAPGPAPIPLERGDRVEVWATTDPSLTASGGLVTRRVADDAVVASADDTAVVVAVHPDEVADVAEAAALATVSVVAVG